jgi:predicted kinase
MQEILILIGIPASGKSTFSIKFLEENPNYIRINRDDIRKMIRNSDMLDFSNEQLVTLIEYDIARNVLNNNKSIIWDNTHLRLSYINNIFNEFKDKAKISFKIFDVDVYEAITRDSNRVKKVGDVVIRKMFSQYAQLMNNKEFINLINLK